tara:strand:- start:13305 stop:13514 length:210 start_codon:yes stop_codon:yes gene_type:complete
MRDHYVTKKQVASFIQRKTRAIGATEETLLKDVRRTLRELKIFPNDNRNQIAFYTKVEEYLVKNLTPKQ